jgi:hypothetical protein
MMDAQVVDDEKDFPGCPVNQGGQEGDETLAIDAALDNLELNFAAW